MRTAPWLDLDLLMQEDPIKGAFLSSSNGGAPARFRFALWRRWDSELPTLAIVMLNPSTADARADDHTVRCLLRFARDAGYGAYIVVNLFAFRATDPFDLLKNGFRASEGPNNDDWIRAACTGRDVLVAWGGGTYHTRVADVLEIITPIATKILSLGVNKDGSPPHPARLDGRTKMVPWAPPVQKVSA